MANLTYSYDDDTKGTLAAVTSAAGSTTYAHDKFGRVAGSTLGTPYTFTYTYTPRINSRA